MFALQGAKPVRREELHSPASSPRSSPDPTVEEQLRTRVHKEFAFTTIEGSLDDAAKSDDEIELRLFATPANAACTTQKIRISSPDAEGGDPSLKVKKPRTYYFANEPTPEELAALQAVAVDGKTVLELSRLPWPGCALPWKVCHISPAGLRREVLIPHPPTLVTVEEAPHKRTRKNKKTRIAIRKKREALRNKQEERAKLANEKEEAEREKRTRRNREKKLKKKAKEQAKKMEAIGSTEEPAEGAQDMSTEE